MTLQAVVLFFCTLTSALFGTIIRAYKKESMYAIVNTTTKAIIFYNTFTAASEACRAYNVLPGDNVYIIDFTESLIEQL